jgi:uncharacterized protein YcnI
MKKISAILPILAFFVASAALAHVSVKPAQVGVGAFQTFTVSVPSEKPVPTVGLRVIIPAGLEHISPTVKPGWTINLVHGEETTETSEPGHEAEEVVKEIVWTGGSIPAEFRDEFTFSAKVPASETSIVWKAYQTYRDGSVVGWEIAPGEEQPKKADGTSDFSAKGPASVTKVVNDLQPTQNQQQQQQTPAKTKNTDALVVSMVAVVLSVLAIYIAKRKPSGA